MRLLLFIHLFSVVQSFLMQGTWLVRKQEGVIINILENTIDIEGTNGARLRVKDLTWKWYSNINLDVGGVDLIVYPNDWYNVVKYSKYVSLYQNVRSKGASVDINILDMNNVLVSVKIANETSPPIVLERKVI